MPNNLTEDRENNKALKMENFKKSKNNTKKQDGKVNNRSQFLLKEDI